MRGPYFLLGPSLLAGSWPGLYHSRAARSHPVPLALAAGVPLRRLALLIGIDDRRHQRMTHHVALVEAHHAYARDALQRIERIAQPAPGARSTWLRSPVTTMRVPSPIRVRNIFICTGVVFCASSRMTKECASVRPRMKASGATSISPLASRLI